MRRLTFAVLALLASAVACGSSGSSGTIAPVATSASHIHVRWKPVVRGLSSPVSIANSGSGSRLYIAEQAGTVRIVHGHHLVKSPYLNITHQVTSGGEEGLLSVAFHPDFAQHPKLYVAYTIADGDLVVAEFTAPSATATHVAPSTERRILRIRHRDQTNHNGGQLFFGNDGYLYITSGDGGGANDQYRRADKRTNLTGKILRVDINSSCGKNHYCIPSSNPYAHSKKFRPEIVAWGLRNPWRASIDAPTNSLWIGDVGQDTYEEIDHVATPAAAHDFGWSCKEGHSTFNASLCGHRHITGPVSVIPHSPGGNCAIIGGDVYRGKKYAGIAGGLYVYTDNCSGRVWGLRQANGGSRNAQIGSVPGGPTGLGLSTSGELYVVSLDGVLRRAKFSKN